MSLIEFTNLIHFLLIDADSHLIKMLFNKLDIDK
jgi:hypothetical protein